MNQHIPKGNTCSLVDAVFLERETSPLSPAIDILFDVLSDPDLVVSPAIVLDVIAIRWVALDVLRGQGYSVEQITAIDTDPAVRCEAQS